LVKSTIKIEFLTSIPARPIKPTIAINEIILFVKNNMVTWPITPNGKTDKTIIIPLKVLNCKISTAISRKIVRIITVIYPPPRASLSISASHDSI